MTAMTNRAGSGPVRKADLQEADRFTVALSALPPRGRRIALRRLALALANQKRTGDVSVVDRFIESLMLTARLARTPDYASAMAEDVEPGESFEVADVVARLERAHDRDSGA